ncbi:hypothetical protein FJQ98_19385 [Lysinibacillus agricola]|uniref:Uncharacterized protein n=1 Tax=Lysinibacillus agricola TaxID=2590012 RepID=A0ABX7AQ06_9BACI|nr:MULTISPECIES: hypothetical protein [Lysinibacillus]KOS61968.1 hypothetical protein AN161_15600 [Lysinibacillus sp. FJAT-14222]QQP11357.1 hypothetical protein FJQ98_19385 [Lysinibacillus agricola]
MELLKHLTRAEKVKIRKAVVKELARYRLSKFTVENSDNDNVAFHQMIERAIERLPTPERFLIEARYLSANSEYLTDYNVYNLKFDPPISSVTYTKIRDTALIKISLFLNLDTGVKIEDLIHTNYPVEFS